MRVVRVPFTDTATVEYLGTEHVLAVESPLALAPTASPASPALVALVAEAMSDVAYTGADVLARAVQVLEDLQELHVVSTTEGEDVYELEDGAIV